MAQPASDAYGRLRGEILHGDLMPGDWLRVADLNARYGLGLTPIREALMRLSSDGLVETQPNRGARVRRTSLAELRDLMEARREVERWCLARSIEQGGADWEAEILSTLHLLNRAALPGSADDRATAEAWEKAHRRFHFALVAACGSDWQLRFWNMLVDHSERYRKLRLLNFRSLSADVRDVNVEHERIARAVIGHDTPAAIALMHTHLDRTEQAVARLLSEIGEAT